MKRLEAEQVAQNGGLSRGMDNAAVRWINKTVFACSLALIVLVLIPYGTVDAWWEAAFECIVFVLTALWLLTGIIHGNWQLKRLYPLLPMFLITGYVFLQTVPFPGLSVNNGLPIGQNTLSIDRYQTHLTAVKTLSLTLFAALLLLQISTAKQFRWLVRTVMAVGIASALFGIIRQLSQSPESLNGFGLSFLYYGIGYGQFISPNAFAFLMEMVFGLIAGLILGGGLRRQQVLIYLAGGLIVWAALILSNSRGGVLGLVCQSIFLLFVAATWYSARRKARDPEERHPWLTFLGSSVLVRILGMLLIVSSLMIGVLWMGGDKLAGKNVTEENTTGLERKDIWHSSWELTRHNLWTGVGFGAFYLAIPEYQKGTGRIKVEQAHNDYLDLAASGGLVAIGLVLIFVGSLIWRGRSSLRSTDPYRRAAALGAIAGILSIAVHSFVDFGLQITGVAVTLLALIVILIADPRKDTSSFAGVATSMSRNEWTPR
jgi:O-antigen ligase